MIYNCTEYLEHFGVYKMLFMQAQLKKVYITEVNDRLHTFLKCMIVIWELEFHKVHCETYDIFWCRNILTGLAEHFLEWMFMTMLLSWNVMDKRDRGI